MFKSARIKLTIWYLLIITLISVSFSVVTYRSLTFELDRVERMQRSRVERLFADDGPKPPFLDPLIIEETKERIGVTLALINLVIISGSAVAGYFLAGKTLRPIEEMVDAQKMFVSNASHELRTPLTSLKTEIEVALRDKKLSLPRSRKLLKSNLEEVDKMQRLSNYLLTLNRYQDENYHVVFRKINLGKLVEKTIMSLAAQAKSKGVTVTRKLKPAYVYGNEDALTELTKILLDNAIKYSHNKGKVVLTLKKEGTKINFSVRDFGIGIKASELPHIFNRFYRADLSRAKNIIDGFGLGLSIAKNIVDMHRGKISVTSKPQKGTTFTITIPVSFSGSLKS